ncbi:unnamed protein product [Staurois parvus]|uniref:Ig-like domain-containing protein n=1 Tax=Staurois parvus TaxID=386267 RepID=A0ABN9GJI2_9NEOB|nr:unnamed protein product [Staurois parvus]
MSDGLHIQIRELFTSPEIQVDPSLFVEEGENVTLKCMTNPKGSAGLLYTFYKDSQMIQSADLETSFVIGKAREEDTGSYRCSVQSQDGKVEKKQHPSPRPCRKSSFRCKYHRG